MTELMNKKIIGVIAFAAIAIATGWGYIQNKQDVELSDLTLENIEALARWEDPNEGQGMEKRSCKHPNGSVYATICCRSASSTSTCHYICDQWGTNCDCDKTE